MSLNKDGKIINKINISKNFVTVYFDDIKIKILESTYLNLHLYKGKELNDEDIKNILEKDNYFKNFDFAKKLLLKRPYSESDLRHRLQRKQIKEDDINNIVNELKSLNLIDDERYSYYLLDVYNSKLYGKYKIVHLLKEKNINKDIIDNIIFDDKDEISKAKILLEKLEKKYKNCNFCLKYKHIENYLINYGYDNSIINELQKYYVTFDEEDEKRKLIDDYHKISIRLSSKPNDINKYKKIVNYLLRKGYKYDLIKEIMEEKNNEN